MSDFQVGDIVEYFNGGPYFNYGIEGNLYRIVSTFVSHIEAVVEENKTGYRHRGVVSLSKHNCRMVKTLTIKDRVPRKIKELEQRHKKFQEQKKSPTVQNLKKFLDILDSTN